MRRNQLIMLAIIASTLAASNAWQQYVYGEAPPSAYLSYAVWFALDLVAIWAIFSIGKVKPHEPEHSPLEYGGGFLFLVGALAAYSIACTALARLVAMFNPDAMLAIESATQLHDWSPEKSMIGNLWPLTAAPVTEEILYRVGILGGLMTLMKRPWAILLSAAIFALAHADIYPLEAVASVFIFGLIAAATYLMLGLRAAIILHLLNNSQDIWRTWIRENEFILNGFVVISMAALAVFIHQLIRHRRMVLR